jgi:hypothetical protein
MIDPSTITLGKYSIASTFLGFGDCDFYRECHFTIKIVRLHGEYIEGILGGIDLDLELDHYNGFHLLQPKMGTGKTIINYFRYFIDLLVLDSLRLFTVKDAPLLINWSWLEPKFKREVFKV